MCHAEKAGTADHSHIGNIYILTFLLSPQFSILCIVKLTAESMVVLWFYLNNF